MATIHISLVDEVTNPVTNLIIYGATGNTEMRKQKDQKSEIVITHISIYTPATLQIFF